MESVARLSAVVVNSNPTKCAATVCLTHTKCHPAVLTNRLAPNNRLIGAAAIRGCPNFPSNVLKPRLVSHVHSRTRSFNTSVRCLSIADISFDSSPGAIAYDGKDRCRTSTIVVAANSRCHGLNVPNRARCSNRNMSCYTAYSNFFFESGPVIIINKKSDTLRRTLFLAHFNSSIAILRHHSRFHTSGVVIRHILGGPGVAIGVGAITATVHKRGGTTNTRANTSTMATTTPTTRGAKGLLSLGAAPVLGISKSTLGTPSSANVSLSTGTRATSSSTNFISVHSAIANRANALPTRNVFITVNRRPTAHFTGNSISVSSSKCVLISNTKARASVPKIFTTNSYISQICHRTVDTTNVKYHTTLSTRSCLTSLR